MEEKKEERQAVIAIAAILILTIFAAVFFQPIMDLFSQKTPPEQTIEYCEEHGAAYSSFTNMCRNSCEFARKNGTVCAQALTTGCDCGLGKCWDGFDCVLN